jgi:hypothetical protein
MDEARRRARHLRTAEALLASADAASLRLEAALHLLRGGEENRGAELLAEAGMEFWNSKGREENADQVVEGLDTALRIYDRQHRSGYEIRALLFQLVRVAYYSSHWELVLAHGERAIDLGLKITGLSLAQRLSRFVGPKLGLKAALIIAAGRFAAQRRRGTKHDLREAITSFCRVVPAAVGTTNICYGIDAVERMVSAAEPLRLFGEDHIATIMHDYALSHLKMGQGREYEARAVLDRLEIKFQKPEVMGAFGEGAFKVVYGSQLFARGIIYVYEFGKAALEMAEQMEQLGARLPAIAATQLRMLYHALRGESEQVQHYRDQVELFAVQGSTTWQTEVFWPVLLLTGEVMSGDTIAVRRTSEQLARRANDLPPLRVYAQAAHAAYLTLRGELSEAIALYEQILPEFRIKRRVAWSSIRAFYADALNRAGEHARAREVVLEVMSNASPEEHMIVGRYLEPQRQLALAEAGLRNFDEATRSLDALLDKYGKEDNPLLIGLLHKARAEVALLMLDGANFIAHLAEMGRCFHAAKNPALISQWERLTEKGTRAGVRKTPEVAARKPSSQVIDAATILRSLGELTVASDRCKYALDLLVQEAGAAEGYLYLLRNDGLQLASASSPNEPPMGLEAQLLLKASEAVAHLEAGASSISNLIGLESSTEDVPAPEVGGSPSGGAAAAASDEEDGDDLDGNTVFIKSVPPEAQQGLYRLVVLSTRTSNGTPVVAGGLILKMEPRQRLMLGTQLIETVAAALHDQYGGASVF